MQGESSSPAWPNPIMFQACRTFHITCLICLSATLQPCLQTSLMSYSPVTLESSQYP